jgi:DNA polymerase-2
MNSFYGVLGSGGCPLYDTRLASSITLRGHEIMQITAQWIEEQGYQVIYGDTDSTFVWLGDQLSLPDAQQIGRDLEKTINQAWRQYLQDHFQLECHLEIEFESCFRRFVMPTIRGSEMGSKKRYAGVQVMGDTEQLVFKGLETVRSDWTPLARQFQTHLYQLVFDDLPVADYVIDTVKALLQGKIDDQLIYRKRLRRPLSSYVKNVPPHIRAARIAEQNQQSAKQQDNTTFNFQRRTHIEYLITLNGAEPIQYQTSPIDHQHYIDKQLKPIAEGILHFIGLSFDQIDAQQLSLFTSG